MSWSPARVLKVYEEISGTSTKPLRVATDVGDAFLKRPSNPVGPHALASDLVGLLLAKWLGVPTLEAVVLSVDALPQPLPLGVTSDAGECLVTREVPEGQSWGGDDEQLAATENPEAIAGLVVLDTWTRNIDRHFEGREPNVENVFFAPSTAGRLRLCAIDFSECLRVGKTSLQRQQFGIDQRCDPNTYGLFDAFVPYLTRKRLGPWVETLRQFRTEDAQAVVGAIPKSWEVSEETRGAMVEFLTLRAHFLAENLDDILAKVSSW